MDAEGGSSNSHVSGTIVSRMSLSPESSEPGSTPKTPDCTSIDCDFGGGIHGFGASVRMTPTPPPSVEGPGLITSLDACRIIGSNPFSISPINFGVGHSSQTGGGSIWSSRNISTSNSNGYSSTSASTSNANTLGQGGDLSHIWSNRQTTPPRADSQAVRARAHGSSQLRWGSLITESPRQDQQQTRISAFGQNGLLDGGPFGMGAGGLVGQLPFSNSLPSSEAQVVAHGRSVLPAYEDLSFRASAPYQHVFQQQQQQQSQQHQQQFLGQPLDDDTFDFVENQFVQDLGVDILRISNSNFESQNSLRPPLIGVSHGYPPSQAIAGVPLTSLVRDPVRQPFSPPPPMRTGFGYHPGTNAIVSTGFTPMHAVNEQSRAAFGLAGMPGPRQISTRFSMRYHGMHTEANASAEHLTADQNCALWLTNLPPDVTPRQLLSAIRKVGRIWCSFINYPDYQSHHTAAAKVVFFSPKATQQFLSDSWTKGLYIGTNRVRVSHNRIKSESKEDELATAKSRVLIITGRAEFVNEAYLTKYFKDRFIFQNDEVTELITAGGRAVLEWKFGSYRCQAQMGKMSLEKDRPYWLEKVEFGEDPCEVGDTYSSYGIAAERIQGRGL